MRFNYLSGRKVEPDIVNFLIALLVFLFCISLRLYQHSDVSVWLDEAWVFYSLFESESSPYGVLSVSGFYKSLLFILSSIMDLHIESNLRLISLLFGASTASVVYYLMRDYTNILFRSLSALLVSLSPLLIIYSQDASVYIFCSFLVTLQFFVYLKWTRHFDFKYALVFGLLGLIAINSRPQIVFFTFVLTVAAFFVAHDKKLKWQSILLSVLVMSPSLLAVFEAFNFVKVTGEVSGAQFSFEELIKTYQVVVTALTNLPNVHTIYSPQTSLTLYYEYAGVFRGVFIGAFITSLIFFYVRKQFHFFVLGLALSSAIVLTFYGIWSSAQLFERYLLIFQPLVIVYLMTFFALLAQSKRSTLFLTLPMSILVVCFWANLSLHSSFGKSISWKPVHKEAFQLLKTHLSDSVSSVCIAPYFFEWPIVKYHLQGVPDIKVQEKSYNFYADLNGAMQVTSSEYLELALAQVDNAVNDNVEQIFIYTRRGKGMLPQIKLSLEGKYTLAVIYESPTISVHKFSLNAVD